MKTDHIDPAHIIAAAQLEAAATSITAAVIAARPSEYKSDTTIKLLHGVSQDIVRSNFISTVEFIERISN